MVVRDAGRDAAVLGEHFGPHLSAEVIAQALAYAAEHREVDAWVDENDRLGEEMERAYLARHRRSFPGVLLISAALRHDDVGGRRGGVGIRVRGGALSRPARRC